MSHVTAFQHALYPFTGTYRNVNGYQMHALDEGRHVGELVGGLAAHRER